MLPKFQPGSRTDLFIRDVIGRVGKCASDACDISTSGVASNNPFCIQAALDFWRSNRFEMSLIWKNKL